MDRWHVLLLLAALALAAGCISPSTTGPCCTRGDALNGTCTMYFAPNETHPQGTVLPCNGGAIPGGLTCATNFCVLANVSPGKNSTIYVKYTTTSVEVLDCTNVNISDRGHPCNNIGYCVMRMYNSTYSANASYPVCSDREELDYDPDCKTMLCGNIKYTPKHSLLPEVGKDLLFQNVGSPYSINLYNSRCDFFVLDNKTMRKLKKGSNIFVNTYRFGLGESISDYEEGKLYFPLSDRWCGFLSSSISYYAKDRYMNYLNLSDRRGPDDSVQPERIQLQKYFCNDDLGGSGNCGANYEYGHIHYFTDDPGSSPIWSGSTFPPWQNLTQHDHHIFVYTTQIPGSVPLARCLQVSPKVHYHNRIRPYLSTDISCPSRDDITSTFDGIVGYVFTSNPNDGSAVQMYECAHSKDGSIKTMDKDYGSFSSYPPNPGDYPCTPAFWAWETPVISGGGGSSQEVDFTYYGPYDPNDEQSGLTNRSQCVGAGTLQLGGSTMELSVTGQKSYCVDHWMNATITYDSSGAHLKFYDFNSGEWKCSSSCRPPFANGWFVVASMPNATDVTCKVEYSGRVGSGTVTVRNFPVQIVNDPNSGGPCYTFSYNCTWINSSGEYTLGLSDFPPAPDGNYLFTRFSEGTGQFMSTYASPDVEMYKFSLTAAWWSQIRDANNPLEATNPAAFECNQSIECMSGTCAKEDYGYERSFCVDKTSGDLLNCMCYEVGRRTFSNNFVYCEPFKDADQFSPAIVTSVNDPNSKSLADKIVIYDNRTETGYIGHAIMDEDEFRQTMFFKACNPQFTNSQNCIEWDNPQYPQDCILWDENSRINITDLGRCAPDDGSTSGMEVPTFPKLVNTYGWCESCSLATMVGINMDEYWKKFQLVDLSGQVSPYNFQCPNTACGDRLGAGIAVGIDEDPDGDCPPQCGPKIKDYVANLAYLRNRIDNYHKSGVMPVLWYVEGNVTPTYTRTPEYKIFHKCDTTSLGDKLPAAREAVLKVLLGNFFYYYPEYAPFFDVAYSSCRIKSEEDCDDRRCADPITAAPADNNRFMGEFGSTMPLSENAFSDEQGVSLQGITPCWPWFYHTVQSMYCNWTAGYYFLRKANGNSASIVIVATDNMTHSQALARVMAVKNPQNCPNCLVALYSPTANKTKLDAVLGCSGGQDCVNTAASTNIVWEYVDVIAYDFVVNYATGPDREKAILDNATGISRTLLTTYGKPSFPYGFAVDDVANSWVPYNDTFETMKYLFENQSQIVNSGMFALFYKKWYRDDLEALTSSMGGNARPPTLKDSKFCAMERTVDIYLNPTRRKTVVNFIKLYNLSEPEAECVACTETEKIFGLCDMTCENGQLCNLTAGNPEDYRCPTGIAVAPCTLCNESSGSLNCQYTYPDGSAEEDSFQINTLSSLYSEIIASMPKENRCCLLYNDSEANQSYYYTYGKSETEGMTTTPVRFPKNGDVNLDCGLGDDSNEFCGVELPIKDYLVDCEVTP